MWALQGLRGSDQAVAHPGVYTPYSFGLARVAQFAIASPLLRL